MGADKDVQVLFQGVVHPRHHGLHHLGWGVPDTRFFVQPEFRIRACNGGEGEVTQSSMT